jgi:FtsP/CotA-like multicopper oxidase with cupredoxin domain
MLSVSHLVRLLPSVALLLLCLDVQAQSFRVQCPSSTTMHASDTTTAYTGPTTQNKTFTQKDGNTYTIPYVGNGGGIKCQQISGGDGFVTMADGTPTYLFGFGPLSGLADLANGLPATQKASDFNTSNLTSIGGINPAIFVGAPVDQAALSIAGYGFNGAVGLVPDQGASTYDANGNIIVNCDATSNVANPACLTGHVDPRLIMDVGVMNANQPAPMMAIDEDDEFFLTLTNVGMIMRPDLFEQHTVHFHGYPNASSFYDGVPDASIAINIGGSFTYYYMAPDAGTYFWHCHISPPEHLQMGMVGQLYVRPRQNRVPSGVSLWASLAGSAPLTSTTVAGATPPADPATVKGQQSDLRTACRTEGILCSTPVPPSNPATRATKGNYAYNDGDGSTYYDVEYPIQIHGFDPNFHFVGMTFNPESFTDMKDKYFMLNGRSYPDTVSTGTMVTQSTDGIQHASQPLPTIVNIPVGGRALLRISDLDVTEYQTLASLGVPMTVIGLNARLLRDLAGNNTAYLTNSITLAGGESIDVILDATDTVKYPAGSKFYLYTPNLDHLSNDAENFGGLMTEVNICPASTPNVDPKTKACSI